MVVKKKMKVREIKKKMKVTELNKLEEFAEEDLDEDISELSEEEIVELIKRHRERMAQAGKERKEVNIGLKQDESKLERIAEEAPKVVKEEEPKKAVDYHSAAKGGNYDARKTYDKANEYEVNKNALAEDSMAKDRKDRAQRENYQERFGEQKREDTYKIKEEKVDEKDDRKKRLGW